MSSNEDMSVVKRQLEKVLRPFADYTSECDDRLTTPRLCQLTFVEHRTVYLCLEGQKELMGKNITAFHNDVRGFLIKVFNGKLKQLLPSVDLDDWISVKAFLASKGLHVIDLSVEDPPKIDRSIAQVVNIFHGYLDLDKYDCSIEELCEKLDLDPSDENIFQGFPTEDMSEKSIIVGGKALSLEDLHAATDGCGTFNYKKSSLALQYYWLKCFYHNLEKSIFMTGGPTGTSAIHPSPEWMAVVCNKLGFNLLEPYVDFVIGKCCCTTPMNEYGYLERFTPGIACRVVDGKVVPGSNLNPIIALVKKYFGEYGLDFSIGGPEKDPVLEFSKPLAEKMYRLYCMGNPPLEDGGVIFIEAYQRIMSGRALLAAYGEYMGSIMAIAGHSSYLTAWMQKLPTPEDLNGADLIKKCCDFETIMMLLVEGYLAHSYDIAAIEAGAELLDNDIETVRKMVDDRAFCTPEVVGPRMMDWIRTLLSFVE